MDKHTPGFDLWRAIDAEGGVATNAYERGHNDGLQAATKHVERLGYFEGDIVPSKASVDDFVAALKEAHRALMFYEWYNNPKSGWASSDNTTVRGMVDAAISKATPTNGVIHG